MGFVRILVDGYSLLHNWPQLAPGRLPHSPAAREALAQRLRQYRDATGTPITIFFDGAKPAGEADVQSTADVEILYSRAGETADQLIERAAHRLLDYGEVLVVTDDQAERQTVISLGGLASSCLNFVQSVESALADLQRHIKYHNIRERNKFSRTKSK
jgi:uncharacterized protein